MQRRRRGDPASRSRLRWRRKLSPLARTGLVAAVCLCLAPSGFDCLSEQCRAAGRLSLLDGPLLPVGFNHQATVPGGQEGLFSLGRAGAVGGRFGEFMFKVLRARLPELPLSYPEVLSQPALSVADLALARALTAEVERSQTRLPGGAGFCGANPIDPRCIRIDTLSRNASSLLRDTRDQRLPDLIPLRRDRDRRAEFTLSDGSIDPDALNLFLDRLVADSVSELDFGVTMDPEDGQAQWMQIVNQRRAVRLVDGTIVQLAGVEGDFEKAGTIGRFFGPDGVSNTADDLPTSALVQVTEDIRLAGKSFAPRKDPLTGELVNPDGNLVARAGDSVQIYRALGAGFDPASWEDVRFCVTGQNFNVPSPLFPAGVNISGNGINAMGECVLLASSREAQFVSANQLGSDGAGDNLLSRFEAFIALGDPSHRPPMAALEPSDLTDLLLRGAAGGGLPARPSSPDGSIRFAVAGDSFSRRVDPTTGAPVRSIGLEECRVRTDPAGQPVGPDGERFGDGSVQFEPGSQVDVTEETRVNIDNELPSEGNCLLWMVRGDDPDGERILRSREDIAIAHSANQTLFHEICTLDFDEDEGRCDLEVTNDVRIGQSVMGVLSGVGGAATAAIATRGWQSLRFSNGVPVVQDSERVDSDPGSIPDLKIQLNSALTLTNPDGILPPLFLFADTQQAVSRSLNNLLGGFSNLATTQKGLLGCGEDFTSPCDASDALLFAQNANLGNQLGLDPTFSSRLPSGVDWMNAHAGVFVQDFLLRKILASGASVGRRDSGPNMEPGTGLSHETGVTTHGFATEDTDGDGTPDNAEFLRLYDFNNPNDLTDDSGQNLPPDQLANLDIDPNTGVLTYNGVPVNTTGLRTAGTELFLATDFEVEPFKYERDTGAEQSFGVPLFKDPRGADGLLGTEDDPLARNDQGVPFGENCANLGTSFTYGLKPDPGCTVSEIVSANFERFAMLRDILGNDSNLDSPETALELRAIFEGDPNQVLVADPIAGPDGIVFANWITEHQTNGGGKLLGLYGFRSDEPNAPIDFGQPVTEIISSAVVGGTALADIVFQLERYQKAANGLSATTLYDPDGAQSFADQCAGAQGGVCYRVLAPSPSDPIVGTLPAGYQMFEVVPASGGPGTGDTTIQASLATGQLIAVATPGGDFVRVPLTLPLQRVDVLDVGEVAGLEGSPDKTAVTAALATVSYLDPDTLELREDVLVTENRPTLVGFFCPAGTTFCYGPNQTVSLFTLDVDHNKIPDLDDNNDGQLDLLDDGTPGPATDDAVACGSGVPGDAIQQVLSAELSAAELEALPSVFPRGPPIRSPTGCPFVRAFLELGHQAEGEPLAFAWHQGAATPDADGDGVPDAEDICPHARDPLQEDSGGVGPGSVADGNGDACQCGDVSNDGLVTLADFVQIKKWVASGGAVLPSPEFVVEKCNVGGSAACSLADFVLVRKAVATSDPSLIQQACEAATGGA